MVDESIYFLNNHRDLPAAGVESFFNHETHERHEKEKYLFYHEEHKPDDIFIL